MPPDNGAYMVAAYVVTPVILGGYLVALWGRVRRAVRRSDGRTVGRSDGREGE